MLTGPYGSSSHDDLLKKLEALFEARGQHTLPLSAEAETLHQDIQRQILEKTGCELSLEARHWPYTDSTGGFAQRNGKKILLFNTSVVTFDASHEGFQAFKAQNPSTSPRDFFRNIVAHEYGHHHLAHSSQRTVGYQSVPAVLSMEADEAFAFWFGDAITGCSSPLQALRPAYSHLDFQNMICLYEALQQRSASEGIFTVVASAQRALAAPVKASGGRSSMCGMNLYTRLA